MTPPIAPEQTLLVEIYLRAKDAQVPYLFRRVFEPDARFIPTYAMPRPFGGDSPREGRQEIVERFRRMGAACENILTVVPVETLQSSENELTSQQCPCQRTCRSI